MEKQPLHWERWGGWRIPLTYCCYVTPPKRFHFSLDFTKAGFSSITRGRSASNRHFQKRVQNGSYYLNSAIMKPARKTQSTSCYHQYCKVGIQSNTWNVAVSFYFIYWNAIPSTKWLTILQLLFAVALASISRNKMPDSNSWRMICIKSWSCLWYLSSTFLLFFKRLR